MIGDLVTVATYSNPVEAQLAKGLLESEGIRSHLSSENYMEMKGEAISDALGGIRLQVPEQDATRAAELLASVADGSAAAGVEESEEAETVPRCPRCGSNRVEHVRASVPFMIFAMLLLGLPLVFRRTESECEVCRHRWR